MSNREELRPVIRNLTDVAAIALQEAGHLNPTPAEVAYLAGCMWVEYLVKKTQMEVDQTTINGIKLEWPKP